MLRRTILGLLGTLLSISARAAEPPKVVLLTSLNAPESVWLTYSWNLQQDLETIFRHAFGKSGYTVEVKHGATAADLAQELQSPDNVGIFWVSHAASDHSSSPVGLDSLIVDEQGIDVSGVFQLIHPNLRYLAIVGCEAKSIFDQYTQAGVYAQNPNLHIQAFDKVVDAEPGMIESLNASLPSLADPYQSDTYQQVHYGKNGELTPESPDTYIPTVVALSSVLNAESDTCPVREGFPIRVTRTSPAGSTAPLAEVQLFVNEKFVGLMPQAAAGTPQTQTIYIPEGTLDAADEMKIKVDSRFAGILTTRPNFGTFEFDSVLPESDWKIFADSHGNPIGITNVLYRFEGSDTAALSSTNQVQYSPFSCAL
jgi:hypothetical protein